MFKKIAVGIVAATLALGVVVATAPTTTSAQGISIQQLVELFITLGIISGDKADAARIAVGSTVPSKSTSINTTVTSPISQSTTGANVSVTASTMDLAYDYGNKEAKLSANFSVTVTAGSSDLNIFTGSAGAYLADQYNNRISSLNSFRIQVGVAAGEKTDGYGRSYTTIAAGHSVQMTVSLTADPRQMFAGTYHAVLNNLYTIDQNNFGGSLTMFVPSNSTNSRTIVGELSPYITSVTGNVAVGQTVVILGQRLAGSTILIDGSMPAGLAYKDGDGSSLNFTLPSLSPGQHVLTLSNPSTGASNRATFQVQGGFSAQNSATVNSSTLSLGYDYARNEASLVGSQLVSITAGASDIFVNGVYTSIKENTGVYAPHGLVPNGVSNSYSGVTNAEQTNVTDRYGNNLSVWRVRAGQTATFRSTLSMNPRLMYAGNYSAYLATVGIIDNGDYRNIPFNAIDSSYVAIVGERANPTVQSFLNVSSPSAGQVVTPSASSPSMMIQWSNSSDFTSANSTVNINLCTVSNQTVTCPQAGSSNVVGGAANTGQYQASVWSNGSPSPAGTYLVKVTAIRQDGSTVSGSGGIFTIAPVVVQAPIVTTPTVPTTPTTRCDVAGDAITNTSNGAISITVIPHRLDWTKQHNVVIHSMVTGSGLTHHGLERKYGDAGAWENADAWNSPSACVDEVTNSLFTKTYFTSPGGAYFFRAYASFNGGSSYVYTDPVRVDLSDASGAFGFNSSSSNLGAASVAWESVFKLLNILNR